MCKSLRIRCCGGVAALALVLLGCGSGRTPAQFSTPEECFEFAQNAVQNKHYAAMVDCLTPETQEVMSGSLITASAMMQAFGGFATAFGGDSEESQQLQQGLAEMDAVLKKHGVNEEALKEVNAGSRLAGMFGEADRGRASSSEAQSADSVKAIAKPVRDHGEFVAEMIAAFEALGSSQDASPIEGFIGELEDVQIAGDEATAVVVKGANEKNPIGFRRTDRGWRIHLDAGMLQQQPVSTTPTF